MSVPAEPALANNLVFDSEMSLKVAFDGKTRIAERALVGSLPSVGPPMNDEQSR